VEGDVVGLIIVGSFVLFILALLLLGFLLSGGVYKPSAAPWVRRGERPQGPNSMPPIV
jgi:hypothetical protein